MVFEFFLRPGARILTPRRNQQPPASFARRRNRQPSASFPRRRNRRPPASLFLAAIDNRPHPVVRWLYAFGSTRMSKLFGLVHGFPASETRRRKANGLRRAGGCR